MGGRMRGMSALTKKYFFDVVKNLALLVCCLMPVVLMALIGTVLGGNMESEEHAAEFAQYLTATSLVFVGAMVPSSATLFPMSEERDKRTLRTLLLAGVSMGQIATARTMVGVLMVALINVACLLVIGTPLDALPLYSLLGILGSFSLVLFSVAAGTVARDQMAASFYCLPIVLGGVIPTLLWYDATLAQVIPFLPTGGAFTLIELAFKGNLLTADAILPLATTLVWIALSAITLAIMVKRTSRP